MLSILLVQELVTCSLRFCGLAHFSTILEMLRNSNRIVISCIEYLKVILYDYFQRRCLLYVLYAIYEYGYPYDFM